MRVKTLILSILLAGCGPAHVDITHADKESSIDSDGDGLTDTEEEVLGTDPLSTDTDGDGWTDGVEDNSYTDPTDPDDHPYEGGWPIDACRYDLISTGMGEGNVINDVTLLDQYDEELRLHDLCNHVIMIEHAGFS
tara:strand:- start:235 stop:642 length:408 start_codon:yes stop_codon:yes gene_type:complete